MRCAVRRPRGWHLLKPHCKEHDVLAQPIVGPSDLLLHIGHDGSHRYLARVFDGKVLVGKPTVHDRIDEAIAAYGATATQSFPGVDSFSIWYGGWSIGRVARELMDADAAELANRLLVLSVAMR